MPCGRCCGQAQLLGHGALGLIAVVLAVERMRCPLTPIAARYTDERQPNLDTYLPERLGRYNKEIFGTL